MTLLAAATTVVQTAQPGWVSVVLGIAGGCVALLGGLAVLSPLVAGYVTSILEQVQDVRAKVAEHDKALNGQLTDRIDARIAATLATPAAAEKGQP